MPQNVAVTEMVMSRKSAPKSRRILPWMLFAIF
jgi:hypothetical protein